MIYEIKHGMFLILIYEYIKIEHPNLSQSFNQNGKTDSIRFSFK